MGYTLNPKKKLVTIKTRGPIVEMGGIVGPVSKARVTYPVLTEMVRNGKAVFELNPKNPKEMVRLTLTNINKNNFNTITETAGMAKLRKRASEKVRSKIGSDGSISKVETKKSKTGTEAVTETKTEKKATPSNATAVTKTATEAKTVDLTSASEVSASVTEPNEFVSHKKNTLDNDFMKQ